MFDLDVEQLAQQLNQWLDDERVVAAVCAVGLVLIALRYRSLRKRKTKLGKATGRDPWHPLTPLFAWSDVESFTLQDSYCGTLALAQTGGGKTTGPIATMFYSMLRAGFGAMVLLVKDDRRFFEDICRRAGRARDVIVFSPNEPRRWNFLNHELARKGRGAGLTENIVNLFTTTMEVVDRNSRQGGGRESDPYWQLACRQLLRNLTDLAVLSLGTINIRDFYRIVISAPESVKEAHSEHWMKQSFCAWCLNQAMEKCPESRRRDLAIVTDYFLSEFPKISPKTRGTIVSTFSVMADSLQRGILSELFCGETNITPEETEAGKIILVDMPVIEYGAVGALANGLWKYGFQRAIEKRDVRKSPRPVGLVIDEFQALLTTADQQFLSTCRGARVATLVATQNVSNLYAALGGRQEAEAEVDSLCGNLCTKIFGCNGDFVTNKWASDMIGQSRQMFFNSGNSYQPADALSGVFGLGQGPQTSAGMSEQMCHEIEPSIFPALSCGGYANGGCIQTLVFAAGKVFRDTGKPWRFHTFHQNL
ncbi:MAG: type IV secretory system conjugative DNA transfer family protein [Pirellulales bacterium]